MKISKGNSLIPVERIERAILLIRGQKVLLDKDLAILYQFLPKAERSSSEAIGRFPIRLL